MKIAKYLIFGFILFAGILTVSTKAQVVSFDIVANNSWGIEKNYRSSTKDINLNRYTAIGWRESDYFTSHKMWFRVNNNNGQEQGKRLFNYFEEATIETNLPAYQTYWLEARTENLSLGYVQVRGVWNA